MNVDDITVEHYADSTGQDCYRICLPDGPCSIVSSAHLIDERKIQLLRLFQSSTHQP